LVSPRFYPERASNGSPKGADGKGTKDDARLSLASENC